MGHGGRDRRPAQGGQAGSKLGGKVVLGGHSLGGSITTAYATWDFNGKPGAKGLSGLVFIDGASSPEATTPGGREPAARRPADGSPWLAFGGIAAPYAGLFNVVGSTTTHAEPDAVGELQSWALLPSNLKPPVAATNQGAYGYALDTDTSPPALAAAQAHLGHLAESGDPRPWDDAGELTPVDRFAKMFSGTGVLGHDGTAWYHPLRLTIDAGAVGDGNPNPAQQILGVNAIHGSDLSTKLRIYAFGAALGGQRVLDATKALAQQSGIAAQAPDARQPPVDLRAQRPELGLSGQRVRGQPRPVPRQDRQALTIRRRPGAAGRGG